MKVAAVLPAYEAEATVSRVLAELPRHVLHEIILVDDCSTDRTAEVASKDTSIRVFRNEKNLGYGGNLKKCLRLALEQGADIIVEIHPDGEYGVGSIDAAVGKAAAGAGLVLGNRFADGQDPLGHGMFVWKYPFIRSLNWAANVGLGTKLGDMHQGFRVYTAPLLRKADFDHNSDGYIFSFEIIAQAVFHEFRVEEVPQQCRYEGAKRGARLGASIKYSLAVFRVIVQFWLARRGMPQPLFRWNHAVHV